MRIARFGITLVFASLLVFTLFVFADAAMSKGSAVYSIDREYSPNSFISGWINLSFLNEPANIVLRGNFGGNITLVNFLELNNAKYNCSPVSCEDSYSAQNGQLSKTFVLNSANKEKVVAFQLNGNVNDIVENSFKLVINASNDKSCSIPLKIDFFNDGVVDFVPNKTTSDFSCTVSGGYGCFNRNENLKETDIVSKPYCNKIKLSEGSSYRLGAYVKKGTTPAYKADLLKMELYDSDGYLMEECNLPEPSLAGNETSCVVYLDSANTETNDFYVCLNSPDASTDYKTQYESIDSCGFFDYPIPEDFKADYWIFAAAAKYDRVGEVKLNSASLPDLEYDLANYIEDNFDNDCDSNDCNIPIKFSTELLSGDVQVSLSDFLVKYESDTGVLSSKNLYDSSITPAKISSGYQKLSLKPAESGAGIFNASSDYGKKTFSLDYGSQQIVYERIEIKKVPFVKSVYPKITAAYKKTNFVLTTENTANQSVLYEWDFGDGGESQETKMPSATYAYEDIGNYTLSITLKTGGAEYEYSFNIDVENPKDAINSTLSSYKASLNRIKSKLSVMPAWYSGEIKEMLSLEEREQELTLVENAYLNAIGSSESSDEDFLEIMANLSEINLPEDIRTSEKALGMNIVSLSAEDYSGYVADLSALSGEDYSSLSEEDVGTAISLLMQSEIQARLDYSEISQYSSSESINLIDIFKVRISPQSLSESSLSDGGAYLFISGGEDSIVSINDNKAKYNEGRDMALVNMDTSKSNVLEFSVEDLGDLENLVVFIAPQKSKIVSASGGDIEPCNFNTLCESELGEDSGNCRSDCKPVATSILLVIIVIAIGVAAFFLLRWWYKYRYENHLFKNRNDLINLMSFVDNALKNNRSPSEIRHRLKLMGWSSEQIDYAYKKFKKRINGG